MPLLHILVPPHDLEFFLPSLPQQLSVLSSAVFVLSRQHKRNRLQPLASILCRVSVFSCEEKQSPQFMVPHTASPACKSPNDVSALRGPAFSSSTLSAASSPMLCVLHVRSVGWFSPMGCAFLALGFDFCLAAGLRLIDRGCGSPQKDAFSVISSVSNYCLLSVAL